MRLRSFRSHVLEGTIAIPKVTVAGISTVLQFAEDNPHGAAVITLCYKILRVDKYCTLTMALV